MLGKLYKQDMKATKKLFYPSYVVFIIVFILNKVMMEIGIAFNSNNTIINYIQVLCMTLYIICIVGLFVLTSVFIVTHFYKTMSGEQGYLTHTLPVKTNTIIFSKLLNAIMWQIITTILIFLSFCVLSIGHVSLSDWQMVWNEFTAIFREYPEVEHFLTLFVIEIALTLILSLLHTPLMFYASIAIGHLFNKHKVGGAVLAYIAIYVVQQVISTISLAVCGFFTYNSLDNMVDFYRVYHNLMLFSLIFTTIITIIFYFITNFIFQKKLNLE